MSRCTVVLAVVAALALSLSSSGCALWKSKERAAQAEREAALPREVRNATDDSAMVLVPSGEFPMGAPAQQKRVTLKAFYIDRNEVTNAQYAKFLADVEKKGAAAWRHPDQPLTKKTHVPDLWSHPDLGQAKANHPVVGVDWFDAYAYAKWADKRLPTEAEWERAARGTDARVYPWGNTPPEKGLTYRANFFASYLGADGFRFTSPVGAFPTGASPVGCLDLAGNVAEWCADWYGPLPAETRLQNPAGPATGTERVTRGGAWNLGADSIRSFSRSRLEPQRQLGSVGFRCAKDASPEAAPPAAK